MTDFAKTDRGCPVLSEGFRSLLESCGVDNLDYYPVTVSDAVETSAQSSYYAANILGLVDCIDREKSAMRATAGSQGGSLRQPDIVPSGVLSFNHRGERACGRAHRLQQVGGHQLGSTFEVGRLLGERRAC